MRKKLKSLLWSLAKADRQNQHFADLQRSGAKVLLVKPSVTDKLHRPEAAGALGRATVVGPDYLMTSADDVDALYYFGGCGPKFMRNNVFFTSLGAIKQYKVRFGKVFLLKN